MLMHILLPDEDADVDADVVHFIISLHFTAFLCFFHCIGLNESKLTSIQQTQSNDHQQ